MKGVKRLTAIFQSLPIIVGTRYVAFLLPESEYPSTKKMLIAKKNLKPDNPTNVVLSEIYFQMQPEYIAMV